MPPGVSLEVNLITADWVCAALQRPANYGAFRNFEVRRC